MTTLSVVICTFNRENLLKPLVDYLNKFYDTFEKICIVDNGSRDNTYQTLIDKLNSNVKSKLIIVKLDENIGPSAGYDLGVSKLLNYSKYILLLDDDCIPENDAIKILKEKFDDSNRSYCGGLISINSGDFDPAHRGNINRNPFNRKISTPLIEHKLQNITSCSLNGLVFPSVIYSVVNGIDTKYYYNYEDIDFSYKISKTGGLLYVPEARFIHMEFRTTVEDKLLDRDIEASSRLIFNRRNLFWIGRKVKKISILFIIPYLMVLIKDIFDVIKSRRNIKKKFRHRIIGFWYGINKNYNSNHIISKIYKDSI
jgi:GT2 family glycosyltransferase